MKTNINTSLSSVIVLMTSSALFGTVSFDLQLELLRDSGGNASPLSTLFLLIADTDGDGIDPLAGANIGSGLSSQLGSNVFFDGSSGGLGVDDRILWRSDLGQGSKPLDPGVLGINITDGSFTPLSTGTGSAGDWEVGDRLWAVWLPELSIVSTTLVDGTSFGKFSPSNDVSMLSGGNTWVTPVNGNTTHLLYGFDSGAGKLGPINTNLADFQATMTVPEPSTYALLLGAFGLVFVYFKKRKRRES